MAGGSRKRQGEGTEEENRGLCLGCKINENT